MVLFPSLCQDMRGFCPHIHCKNLMKLLEVNLIELRGPLWLGPLLFLTFRVVHIEPQLIHKLWFRFSYSIWHWFWRRFLLVSLHSVDMISCNCFTFSPVVGPWFALYPYLSPDPKKWFIFQYNQFFACQNGGATSKLLTCRNRHQKYSM